MSEQKLAVYVITIERAAERLNEIVKYASASEIDIERVNGVDGSLIPREAWVDVDHESFTKRHGRTILPGEYGCYRSHLAALHQFLASSREAAIIVEDDVLLDRQLLGRAKAALDAAPSAEVIKLVNHRWNGFMPRAKSASGDILGRCLFGPQGSAACYLVTRAGAERLVTSLKTMSLPWDVALERGWAIQASIFSTRSNVLEFVNGRTTTMIGTRVDYRRAKLAPWRRINTYLFRVVDFFRRIFYVLSAR